MSNEPERIYFTVSGIDDGVPIYSYTNYRTSSEAIEFLAPSEVSRLIAEAREKLIEEIKEASEEYHVVAWQTVGETNWRTGEVEPAQEQVDWIGYLDCLKSSQEKPHESK